MAIDVTLLGVSDDLISLEYNRRRLGSESLDDVSDFEIEQEYKDRGLDEHDVNFENATVQQLIDEIQNRGVDWENVFESSVELADSILNDMHQSKCVTNRVRHLIEKLTGRLICN